ncbi:MAG: transcriptional regulator, partial [Deltaproteobacteria bacterium]|nr:transcriptional regulator [Deltaproteobacteria bacterium]
MPEQDKNRGESGSCFGTHRLDVVRGQLWRGKQEVKVAGKVFAVLQYFVAHAGQLVSKDELLTAVWPDTIVSEATLASCIQDLRQALGDKAKKPRYIETVHGRGYRFIAEVVSGQEVVRSQQSVASIQGVASSQYSVDSREEPSANGQEMDAVLPQAGIQEFQAEALSESPWIPASAGMTPLPPSLQP